MSRYFQRLRLRFCDLAEEASAYLKSSRDLSPASHADELRARLRKSVVPLYRCMAASPLLGARDCRDFATHVREMDAALEFRKFRGRRNDERLRPGEAEYHFREAYRRVLELLDFVPGDTDIERTGLRPVSVLLPAMEQPNGSEGE